MHYSHRSPARRYANVAKMRGLVPRPTPPPASGLLGDLPLARVRVTCAVPGAWCRVQGAWCQPTTARHKDCTPHRPSSMSPIRPILSCWSSVTLLTGLRPGANLCEIWQRIVQCPARCCHVDLWLSWKILDKAAAHGSGGQRGEAYLGQSGGGCRGHGAGDRGDTWHLACGSVWRGLELITDHLHSEQTLTPQLYLHSNIYTAIFTQ